MARRRSQPKEQNMNEPTTIETEARGHVGLQRSVRLLDYIKVKWQNWRVRKTVRAYRTLTKAMRDDPGYALSWQCNITMTIYDNAPKGSVSLMQANAISDKLMAHLFEVKKPNYVVL